jgi:N-methylhydantoinase B
MDTAGLRVTRGTRLLYCSNGGGGFGPAHERSVDLVLADLKAGFIDAETAASVYGVMLTDAGELDQRATRVARAQLAAAPANIGLGPGQVHPLGVQVCLAS